MNPVICSDMNGGAIVAWSDSRGFGDVYAQRVDPDGNLLWNPTGDPIANEPAEPQQQPRICSDGTGGAIIAWQDFRVDGDGDIYAQRVLPTGSGAWQGNGTPICNVALEQSGHFIAPGEDGGAIIGWIDARETPRYVAYVQRISGTGTVRWNANGIPVSNKQHDANYMQACSDGDGGAFVVWEDSPLAGPAQINLFSQRVGSSGTLDLGTNGNCICNATDCQQRPEIVYDGTGKAVVAWYDLRSGVYWDLYAQQLTMPPKDDGLMTIIIIVVVCVAAAAVLVVLILLYKKGKLPLLRKGKAK